MKIVIDTNVLVLGIFFSGPPYKILHAWNKKQIQLLISLEIVEEYRRVCQKLQLQYPTINANPILKLLVSNSEMLHPGHFDEQICSDKTDDKFIECAYAGKARIIVSGDKHLLTLKSFSNIQIIKPKEFVDNFLS